MKIEASLTWYHRFSRKHIKVQYKNEVHYEKKYEIIFNYFVFYNLFRNVSFGKCRRGCEERKS